MHEKCIIIGVIIACLSGYCFGATHYLVTNGTPGVTSTAPYTNWATAGTNIIDVLNVAMTNAELPRMVWVSNGTYYLTNQVIITNALTFKSVNGREVTIVDGNSANRCFYISNGVTLDGFAITNGYTNDAGGGVWAYNVNIYNCLVTGNRSSNTAGGIYLNLGKITNCIINGNTCLASANSGGGGVGAYGGALLLGNTISGNVATNKTGDAIGGGVRINSTAIISNCMIYGNTSYGIGGGICIQNGPVVYNCLVYGNRSVISWGGGIAVQSYSAACSIRNCTIVSNSSANGGGGIGQSGNVGYTNFIQNTISYFNTGSGDSSSNLSSGAYMVSNCCIAPLSVLPVGSGMNIESDPQFVNKDTGNWRLKANSPCVNAGTNENWMTNSVDLDGRMRIRYGIVDMGAYETICNGTIYRLGF